MTILIATALAVQIATNEGSMLVQSDTLTPSASLSCNVSPSPDPFLDTQIGNPVGYGSSFPVVVTYTLPMNSKPSFLFFFSAGRPGSISDISVATSTNAAVTRKTKSDGVWISWDAKETIAKGEKMTLLYRLVAPPKPPAPKGPTFKLMDVWYAMDVLMPLNNCRTYSYTVLNP